MADADECEVDLGFNSYVSTAMSNALTSITHMRKHPWAIAAAIAPIFLIVVITYMFFGSFDHAAAWLGGARVWVSPHEIDLGKVDHGTRTVEVTLANFHNQPLQIVGGRGACKCISMPDMPIEFAPHAPVKLDLTVTIDDDASQTSDIVRQSFVLFTNVPGNERLEGVVSWRRR